MWVNHLDTKVKRSCWSEEEDLLLFSYVLEEGGRWSTISKMLNGTRTEHMVKNRYNSIVKKYQSQLGRPQKVKFLECILENLKNKNKKNKPEENFISESLDSFSELIE